MTEQLAQLQGVSVAQREPSALERILERYVNWLPTVTWQTARQSGLRDAVEAIRDIGIQREDITKFLQVYDQVEHRGEPQHAGLFLSALLARIGPGQYQLANVAEMSWVGYGLGGYVLEAEAFGSHAGTGVPHVVINGEPKRQEDALVLRGKTFGADVGSYADSVTIYSGTFDRYAATSAKHVVIHDGTFEMFAGEKADSIVIHNGTFNMHCGESTKKVIIEGGTFADIAFRNVEIVVIQNGTFRGETGRRAKQISLHEGIFDDSVGQDAIAMTVYGGTFTGYAGSDAEHVIVFGGMFTSSVGLRAKCMDIYGGTFKGDVGRICEKVTFNGGTYRHRFWEHADYEREKGMKKIVAGTVVGLGRKGVAEEWKVVPY